MLRKSFKLLLVWNDIEGPICTPKSIVAYKRLTATHYLRLWPTHKLPRGRKPHILVFILVYEYVNVKLIVRQSLGTREAFTGDWCRYDWREREEKVCVYVRVCEMYYSTVASHIRHAIEAKVKGNKRRAPYEAVQAWYVRLRQGIKSEENET